MSEHDQIDEKTIEQLYEEVLRRLKETLIKALPRQGESEKTLEYQHVKPKAFMLI